MKSEGKKSALSVKPGVQDAQSLNPALANRLKKNKTLSAEAYVEGILKGDVGLLSRAITLIESKNPQHQKLSQAIIAGCLPHSGKALRIGISGVPGAGKSTFIESFGTFLIEKHNQKVAVLAIDPSSNKTGGSILGDKTRMERLSQNAMAFIRPSPSAGSLGGVARKTRESIILCEAAGYGTLLIETVGVGQSEVAVKNMVDFFALLLISGAGDELQGIKRGIMEMADGIWINKADGENVRKAKLAAADVKRALHLYPADPRGWTIPVGTCSALMEEGLSDLYNSINEYAAQMKHSGWWDENRQNQNLNWLEDTWQEKLLTSFRGKP